jgi:hypothetical protein
MPGAEAVFSKRGEADILAIVVPGRLVAPGGLDF